jgi:hypothetical protein
MKARRQPVFVLPFWPAGIAGPPAGVCYKLTSLVVNRDHDTAVHDAAAGMVPQTERGNGLLAQSPFSQVGVRRTNLATTSFTLVGRSCDFTL